MSSKGKPEDTVIKGTTIADVAAKAGVSPMTVSRFFNAPDKLSQAMYERVERTVRTLNFLPNATARALTRGATETLALVMADMSHPFFMEVAHGVEQAAQHAGYTLLLGNSQENLRRERQYLDALMSKRVDGIILAPTHGKRHNLDIIKQRGIPTLLIDRRLPNYKFDIVRGDTFTGGYILTKHLVEQGYRDVAFIGGHPGISSLVDRVGGYRKALRKANLQERILLGRYDQASGFEIVDRLVRETTKFPDALVTANNMVAVGALLALRKRGLEVPKDVALATFDDFEVASLLDPFLTVIKQPALEIGEKAAGLLLRRIHDADLPCQELVLPVELVVRRSTQRS